MPQSQISQFSDVYSSSLYEGDHPDNLAYLPSHDQQIFPPDLSCSQQTLNAASDSDFLRPSQPPPIPDTLQCVGPDRRKVYVLYSDMSKEDFVSWWLKTDFGRKKRMRWDSRHQSDCWKYFDQVAHITTGEPKVICNRCAKVLDHPQHSRHGTSTMNKHIQGVTCRNATNNAAKQPKIKQLMQDAVSTKT